MSAGKPSRRIVSEVGTSANLMGFKEELYAGVAFSPDGEERNLPADGARRVTPGGRGPDDAAKFNFGNR